MKEEENRKAAPVVLKAERPPVGADVEATRIAEARSVEETAETKEQEVAEHDNDWMFGGERLSAIITT